MAANNTTSALQSLLHVLGLFDTWIIFHIYGTMFLNPCQAAVATFASIADIFIKTALCRLLCLQQLAAEGIYKLMGKKRDSLLPPNFK